jgi:predicted Zn-dependent protease
MNTRSFLGCLGLILTLSAFSITTSGCSTNLATGERHLSLVSESQEIAMGQEYDAEAQASLGVYDSAELQRYVQELGTRIAARTERTNLPWTFRVVDDPVVNAFALPGGFIYITRGLLGHMNNEAQLAGVMAHEIGHVTARHSVNNMSNQMLAQLGLGIGMILAPEEMQKYGSLASTALSILFLKFSRDDENQADALSVRYMGRVNQDPRELIRVMNLLEKVSESSGGGRIPEWLSCGPPPPPPPSHRHTHLGGLTFGDNPREGYFRGNAFYHPELKFRLDFPQGWKTANQRQAVLAQSEAGDALLQVTLANAKSAAAASDSFFTQKGISATQRQSQAINGLTSVVGAFSATTGQGSVGGRAAFVEYDGRVYQILGYSTEQKWSGYQGAVNATTQSFSRLTDKEALSAQPMRIKIVTLPEAMTLEQFAKRYPSAVPLATVALANQVDATTKFKKGDKLKQIVGQ